MQHMTPLQQQTVAHCESLHLEYAVLGSGSPSSQIAVIAEFPGETEVILKQPLIGNSGRLLWEKLGKINVRREHCYITNVVKRPLLKKDNDGGREKSAVSKEELAKWATVLRQELNSLPNLKYILVLGNVALEAITGHTGIKKWRGSVLEFDKMMGFQNNGHMLISYNPAFMIHDPTVEVHFSIDVARFNRLLTGKYKPHLINHIINPTKREAIDFLRKMAADGKPVSYDIETINNETACIGFANDPHEGMCINFRTFHSTSRFDIHEEIAVRLEIAELFKRTDIQFVAQNGNFDSYWMRYKDRIKTRVDYDTLLAHHTLYPSLPHSLAFLTTAYTEHPFYKDDKDGWKDVGDIDSFWRYNVKDCCITHQVASETHKELRAQQLDKFFFNHVMRLQPHLVEMTSNGILIDTELKKNLAVTLAEDVDKLEADFVHKAQLAVSDPTLTINPNSPKQMRELFFDKLKLVGIGKSTDEDNRRRIGSHPNTSAASKEMLAALDKYKEEHKFLTTYARSRTDDDDRMRCEWRQWGTTSAPGRLSSGAVMWESGMNLQNQPERARSMFIAPPGYGFVYFDLSQAEARYVAIAWGVKGLIENFRLAATDPDNYDVHRLNAARIFNVPYDTVPKEDWTADHKPTLRYQGKRSVHGFNYRLMPDTAAAKFGVSVAEATRAHRLYHAAFPEIGIAWQDLRMRVERDKKLYNAYGRRWVLLSRIDDEILTPIVAFEPQSSIGDKVCEIIYLSHEDPEWPRSRNGLEAAVTLNIHDALIALARLEDMPTVASIFKRHAAKPLIVRDQELVIPADIKLSVPDDNGIHRWSTITQKWKG